MRTLVFEFRSNPRATFYFNGLSVTHNKLRAKEKHLCADGLT